MSKVGRDIIEVNSYKKKRKNNNSVLIVVVVILSLLCGLLGGLGGAYLVVRYVPTVSEQIVKNVSSLEIKENSIADAVDKVYDAVVVVQAYTSNGQLYSSGTGFVYKLNGDKAYIMTNNHVVEGSTKVVITFSSNVAVEATILGGETYSDIAVLSVDADDIEIVANMGDTSELRVGDTVFTIGSPEGIEYAGTVTKGVLSSKDRMVAVSYSNSTSDYYMKVLQTDAAINPGNSGGPLININGEVIGITNMKLVDDSIEGMGFAIPIEDALYYSAILETGQKVVRPFVGISMLDVNTDSYYMKQYGVTIPEGVTSGVVVLDVQAGSPASNAGLVKGDIIIELGGKETLSLAEFRYELYKHQVGEEVEVKYLREGKEQTTKITLGKNE